MEKILLFQVKDADTIKKAAAQMRIKTDIVESARWNRKLGVLAGTIREDITGNQDEGNPADMACRIADKSLMLMCGLSEKHMDRLLYVIRQNNINVDYKAVLTPVNARWTLDKMYMHMAMEQAGYR